MPVYNVPAPWLEATIESVLKQSYCHWQLCLVNDNATEPHIREVLDRYAAKDPRIRIDHNQDNLGIAMASNIGLEMASGDFIALLDHDDLLPSYALTVFSHWQDHHPEAELFYGDEDKVDIHGRFSQPFFKPDYSPELLLSQNYIVHLVVIKRTLMERIGGFRPGFDGAQDYDLLLRATKAANQVVHIPYVLYHWRQIPGSTAMLFGEKDYAWEAGRQALQDFHRQHQTGGTAHQGEVPGTYRHDWPLDQNQTVSILIPFRDQPELLQQCLESILAHTEWQALEIIGIDNQSDDPEIAKLKQHWQEKDRRIRFMEYNQPFNFSAICNAGVKQASGEYIVLMNNDIQITTKNWIENLLKYANQGPIGAIGAILRYPDHTIQHAGIVIGIGGGAGHAFKGFPKEQIGYFGRLKITSNVSAVTAALLMVKKTKYLEVDGLDEEHFSIALNDVDFCLKLRDRGYRNIVTPDCQAIHHESVSRGYEISSEQSSRFKEEKEHFSEKWSSVTIEGDPSYNVNLTLDSEDYRLRE